MIEVKGICPVYATPFTESGRVDYDSTRNMLRVMIKGGVHGLTLFGIAGYAAFPLMAYHFTVQSIVPQVQIPIFFAIAMGVDALVALLIGRAYDKRGLIMLATIPVLTIPIPILAFSSTYLAALLGVIIWGAAMGVQETIMRAAIAGANASIAPVG